MMNHNYCGGEDYLIALGETRVIAQFISYLENGDEHSKETLNLYHDYLTQLLEYFVQHASTVHKKPFWRNLDKRVLVSYNSYLCREGDTQEMIAEKMAMITAFFNYMVSSGTLEINPLEDIRSHEDISKLDSKGSLKL
jgi:site-specific recombinase XerC